MGIAWFLIFSYNPTSFKEFIPRIDKARLIERPAEMDCFLISGRCSKISTK